jgi:hypothetical protein
MIRDEAAELLREIAAHQLDALFNGALHSPTAPAPDNQLLS